MTEGAAITNEQLTADAFTRQSEIFDDIYAGNTIVLYKRRRIRDHVVQFLPPHSRILELNAGTGDDAIWFASGGHTVHATDISDGMQQQLRAKAARNGLSQKITTERCSFTELGQLSNKGPYDFIFSNFAGLNCTDKLEHVLHSFSPLLVPGGLVTLVLLPKFCFWETALLLKGKFQTALRRFNAKDGTDAHIEGVHFKCWYYNPSFVIRALKKDFDVMSLEGLCTFVPPSYIEHFAEKYPKLYQNLVQLEDRFKAKVPWRRMGDYYIITLRKKS